MSQEIPEPILAVDGFAEQYATPEDQVSAEFALIDKFTQEFPDQLDVLIEDLNIIKTHAGFSVPSGLEPMKGEDNENHPNALPHDENGQLIRSGKGVDRLFLQNPAPEIDPDYFKKLKESDQLRFSIERTGIAVFLDLPLPTKALLDGLYDLIGAEVIGVEGPNQRESGIMRRGTYNGEPVYLKTLMTTYRSEYPGREPVENGTALSVLAVSKDTVKRKQDSQAVEAARKIIDSVDLDE